MGIASFEPGVAVEPTPNLPKIEPASYQSIVNDDNTKPLRSLIAYIEGAPWAVDYYSQIVSTHNDLREIDPGQPGVYQQYQKINGLEIRVSTPLSTTYDTNNAITGVSGSGLLYPFIIPNISDYFVTDADDQKQGLFRVTNVNRKTFNRDSAFEIEYEMVGYVDVVSTLYNDLIAKVIKNYYFSKDRLIEGKDPIIRSEEYQNLSSLSGWYQTVVQHYFSTFFNAKYGTLVLPGQDYGIYDSFLVDYLLKITDSFDAFEIRQMKQITIDNDLYLKQPQFWSLMFNRDYLGLLECNTRMEPVNKKAFNSNSFLKGLAFSNLEYILYPDLPDTSSIVHSTPSAKPISLVDLIETTNVNGTLATLLTDTFTDVNTTYPYIRPVTVDDYYVLSSDFYNATANQTLLEQLTKDYLKSQTINLNKLVKLCEKYRTWARLEQFYYGPILLTLIKEADRTQYS